MSNESKRRGGTSAAELMAQLEADPEFQRKKAEREAVLGERRRVLAGAEAPIVSDLRSAGVEVNSVWDLVNRSVPYPKALPVLMEHLKRGGYPDRVMESLGRALAVGPASVYWQRLRELYGRATGVDEKDGLAVAMAASATAEHLDAMIDILGDASWGSNRIYLLRAILRVGGTRGHEVVASLTDDPVLGKEVSALMEKKR
jgi:hypothetical protein